MLVAANGPWNNSKGHLLLRVGPNVPNTCQGVPNTPPDGTSAMRQTSHHAVSPWRLPIILPWGGNFLMGR